MAAPAMAAPVLRAHPPPAAAAAAARGSRVVARVAAPSMRVLPSLPVGGLARHVWESLPCRGARHVHARMPAAALVPSPAVCPGASFRVLTPRRPPLCSPSPCSLGSLDVEPDLNELELRNVKVGAAGAPAGEGCCRALAGTPKWPPPRRVWRVLISSTAASSTTQPALCVLPQPLQEVSYVSRRRMDAADFDPNEVDEDGLPLVGAAAALSSAAEAASRERCRRPGARNGEPEAAFCPPSVHARLLFRDTPAFPHRAPGVQRGEHRRVLARPPRGAGVPLDKVCGDLRALVRLAGGRGAEAR